ncbi:MAG: electron transporter [Phyllobacteriaceae bacterium]|uniref:SCO family protein n=1 Tax=Nitratireductor alexandrii TaxID=2448161 RepID=UPI000C3E8280|nr:SCO family protein [Nitratireductor alexandrii]MAW86248.1 electron transporter [Phyllobacteriaceae bacterium]
MTSTKTTQLRRIRFSLWILVAAAALALGGAYFVRTIGIREPPPPVTVGEAAIRSEFSLIDHNGNRVTEADFLGRWQLVFFGFTHCPDVCPTTLAYMANVLDRLGEEVERVAPIFITVDPSRDTPEVMAEYVQAFHPKLVGLTGSEAEVAAAAQSFRVYYEKMEEETAPDGYLMAHSGHIYLMTPEGRFEDVFREGDQSAEEMATDILPRMNRKQ